MGLVNAKCTNCGSTLQVDADRDAMKCPYCGSAFIVEKAIQNFNIVNQNTINADVINIVGGNNDFVIKAGVLVEYRGAATHVEVPDGVIEIDGYAFDGKMKYITEITLPASVKVIKTKQTDSFEYAGAFCDFDDEGNEYLPEKLDFKGSISDWCGIDFECLGIEMCLPLAENIYIGGELLTDLKLSGVEEIGAFAFYHNKNISNLQLSEGLRSIEMGAFEGCYNLKSVTIPKSVSLVRDRAFLGVKNLKINKNLIKNKICVCCGNKLPMFGSTCKKCGVTYEWID